MTEPHLPESCDLLIEAGFVVPVEPHGVVLEDHAVAIDHLPPLHKNPFDRLLVAQAMVEGIPLLTADAWVAQYPGLVRKV